MYSLINYSTSVTKVLYEDKNFSMDKNDVVSVIAADITPSVDGYPDLDLSSYVKSVKVFLDIVTYKEDFKEYQDLTDQDFIDWVESSVEYKEATENIFYNIYTDRVTLGLDVDDNGDGPFSTVLERDLS
jgi:hypothetical protein